MLLKIGLIFRGKKITYDDSIKKVYKAVDIDVGGWGRDDNGVYWFNPLKRQLNMYVLSSENREIVGEEFDDYKFYAGIIDVDEFFEKYYHNDYEYHFDDVKKLILKKWNGYYTLGYDMRLNQVINTDHLKIIEEKFNNIIDDWFLIKSSNKTSDKSKLELSKYGTFLTDKKYAFNPAIGRDREIERLERTLLGYDSSGMLIGESGVGKTAIVEGLAYKIQKGLVHEKLKNYNIVSISASSMVSGCRYVGDVEKRMETIINELKNNKNIIMFIDEIHSVIGAGKGEKSNLDIANILKPHLDRGDIKIIGSTTSEEYENLINDNAFKRRFKKINVLEPDKLTLYKILDGVICGLEKHYNIQFNFLGDVKNRIYRILYELTSKKSIDFKEQANNPYLILSIIKDAFSIADYKYHTEITIDDLIQAIDESDRIYPSVRERFKLELKKVSLVDVVDKENFVKVLKLPSVDKNSLT